MDPPRVPLVDAVVDWFARDPIGPALNLPGLLNAPPADLYDALEEQLALVPEHAVAWACAQPALEHVFFISDEKTRDRAARAFVLIDHINEEIGRRRIAELQIHPPAIASHPALEGISFDAEGLICLGELLNPYRQLIRNGFVFMVAPVVEQGDSSYWLVRAIVRSGLVERTRVRIDPFLFGEAGAFHALEYRMLLWGKSRSWSALRDSSGSEALEWQPDSPDRGVQRTQLAWSARGSECHLEVEELHTLERNEVRGTRYLHAIFDSEIQSIVHLDGAVRILSESEWHARNEMHLKNLGKVGKRVKIFRVDGTVSDDSFATVAASFFVWNDDIPQFFWGDSA